MRTPLVNANSIAIAWLTRAGKRARSPLAPGDWRQKARAAGRAQASGPDVPGNWKPETTRPVTWICARPPTYVRIMSFFLITASPISTITTYIPGCSPP